MSEEHQTETSTEDLRRPPPAAVGNGLADGAEPHEPDDAPAPSWREDWRTALANGDERRLKQLERFSTPETLAKTFFDVRDKLSRGLAETEPPEAATDGELKEWRRRAGVPETPEGYEIAFPQELKPTEADTAELNAFLGHMHSKNVTPRAAKAAFEFYMTTKAARAEQEAEAAENATRENLDELRATFPGREWTRMFGKAKRNGEYPGGLANDFLQEHFPGPDGNKTLKQILDAKLPTGVTLSDSAPFLKFVVAMARRVASEDQLIGGDGGGGGKSIDEEFAELTRKPRPTQAERDRMLQLAEAQVRRAERAAR